MSKPLAVRVWCYAGYAGEQEPRRFALDGPDGPGREIAVLRVLDRWLDPSYRYFKVLGDDQVAYTLRHDTKEDLWELTMLGAPGSQAEDLTGGLTGGLTEEPHGPVQ